jgi:hypothetical protein
MTGLLTALLTENVIELYVVRFMFFDRRSHGTAGIEAVVGLAVSGAIDRRRRSQHSWHSERNGAKDENQWNGDNEAHVG